jgi:hypothetical protein
MQIYFFPTPKNADAPVAWRGPRGRRVPDMGEVGFYRPPRRAKGIDHQPTRATGQVESNAPAIRSFHGPGGHVVAGDPDRAPRDKLRSDRRPCRARRAVGCRGNRSPRRSPASSRPGNVAQAGGDTSADFAQHRRRNLEVDGAGGRNVERQFRDVPRLGASRPRHHRIRVGNDG